MNLSMSAVPGTQIILVVDDELAVLSLTQMILAREGFGVLVAASGQEALHLFEVWPDIHVDLLLVDLMMPDMNGVELAKRIRRFRPELPFLYFSGYSDHELLDPKVVGIAPFIAKPFGPLELTKRVREMLHKPNTQADAAAAE